MKKIIIKNNIPTMKDTLTKISTVATSITIGGARVISMIGKYVMALYKSASTSLIDCLNASILLPPLYSSWCGVPQGYRVVIGC